MKELCRILKNDGWGILMVQGWPHLEQSHTRSRSGISVAEAGSAFLAKTITCAFTQSTTM